MSSTPKIEAQQIRIAYVEFIDKPGKGKSRPVLIIDIDDKYAYCLKITTVGNPSSYPRLGLNYRDLGLEKPSFLQLAPIYEVPLACVRDYVSTISPELVNQIRTYLETPVEIPNRER